MFVSKFKKIGIIIWQRNFEFVQEVFMRKTLSAALALSALLLAACGASNDYAGLRNDASRVYDNSARLRNDASRVYDDFEYYADDYADYSAKSDEDYLYDRSYGDRRLERDANYGNSAYRLYEELPGAYRMGTDAAPRATENLSAPRQYQPMRDVGRTAAPTPTRTATPATAR
jgi:hypothetical protein